MKEKERQKHRDNSAKIQEKRKLSDPKEKGLKSTDSGVDTHIDHVHRLSSPLETQRAQDFLCNSPLSRQRRMASDSDNVFQMPPGGATIQPPEEAPVHIRHSSSNRSSSSTGAGNMDECSRNSDSELKKQQQVMHTSYYEKKNVTNLNSSVVEGLYGADVPPPKDHVSPGWRRVQTPPESPGRITTKVTTSQDAQRLQVTIPHDPTRSSSQEMKRISIEVPSSGVTGSVEEDDLPSPPLLDTTKDLSPVKPGLNAFNFPGSLEYSPPPHPWKPDMEPSPHKLRPRSLEGSTSQSLQAHSPGGRTSPRLPKSHSEEVSESLRSFMFCFL
jgi:hypothetical protein